RESHRLTCLDLGGGGGRRGRRLRRATLLKRAVPVGLLERLEELAHNLMKLLTACASPERVAAERSMIRRSSSRCATISAAALPRSAAPAADQPQRAVPRQVKTKHHVFRRRS